MKYLNLLAIMLALTISSCKAQETQNAQINSEGVSSRVELIDFYGTHRCMTCEAIEANSKYTVETYFKEELKSGLVTFQTINVDQDENYEVAKKFEAAGTALFLNVIKDGQEQQIDLTSFAFLKGTDQLAFSNKLKEKIEEQLKSL